MKNTESVAAESNFYKTTTVLDNRTKQEIELNG